MKFRLKPTKNESICILIVVLIVFALMVIDVGMVEKGSKPIFCFSYGQYLDGGTKEYFGFGYKIIDYQVLDGFDGYKVGTWFMKYDSNLSK